jgi:hypothetical protein
MPYYHRRLAILPRALAAASGVWLGSCHGGAPDPSAEAAANGTTEPVASTTALAPSRLIGEPAPVLPDLVVELLDPGREPRQLLRYAAAPGTRQRARYQVRGGNDLAIGGRHAYSQQGVTSESWLELKVVAVEGDRLDCEIRFERAETLDLDQLARGQPNPLRRSIDWMRSHRYRFTVDGRGFIHQMPPLDPPPGNESDRDMARSVVNEAVRATVPLPAEPVGVGARWRLDEDDRGRLSMAGRVVTELELLAMRGRRLELSVRRRLSAADQILYLEPTRVMGASRIRWTSRGRAVIDLGLLQPVAWESETESELDVVSAVLGEQMPLRVRGTTFELVTGW